MGGDQRRAILAVVLSGIVLFGWQYFMGPEVPAVNTSTTKNQEVTLGDGTAQIDSKLVSSDESITSNDEITKSNRPTKVQEFLLKSNNDSYILDNNLNLIDATYSNTEKKLSEVFSQKKSGKIHFNLNGVLGPLYFDIQQVSNNELKVSNNDLNISGKIYIDEKGLLNINLISEKNFQFQVTWSEKEQTLENGQLSKFVFYGKDLETINIGDSDNGDKLIKWSGIDFNYHLLAAVFHDKQNFLYNIDESGTFSVKSNSPTDKLLMKYVYTKKEYDHLISLGDNLDMSVDFGVWSLIAVPILRGLQFFFSVIPNYGISIILLTLIIRMLTFPLQYKSFKSMKKMQDIQPELTKVREKFKDNPQKMQQETMALFKKAGANPLSGCLPLLLQMPIFFAFYKVLYSAVELVDAPFYLWISDLSEKDPYYVLPVLMALSMFFQQKFTPTTTTDPVQKKLMMFMPLLFGLFMKDLPAGLTLYIFISTLVGMAQQLLVFKRT